MSDPIQPDHYRWHPSGIEAIEVTEHFSFCLGNAIKYIWRAGRKGEALEDLKKARYYVDREIARIERVSAPDKPASAPTPEEIAALAWFGDRFGGTQGEALRTLLEKLK